MHPFSSFKTPSNGNNASLTKQGSMTGDSTTEGIFFPFLTVAQPNGLASNLYLNYHFNKH
jgi:hypothetical protein